MHNNKNPDIRMPKLTKSTEFSTAQALMRSICDRTGDISCLQAKSGKFYEPMGLVKSHPYLTPLNEHGSLHRAYHRCGLSPLAVLWAFSAPATQAMSVKDMV